MMPSYAVSRGRSIALAWIASLACHGVIGGLIWWQGGILDFESNQPAFIETVCFGLGDESGTLDLVDTVKNQSAANKKNSAESDGPDETSIQEIHIDDLPTYQEEQEPGPRITQGTKGTGAASSSGGGPGPGAEAGSHAGTNPGSAARGALPMPSRGQSIVYLVDQSISMGLSGGLDKAKAELCQSLDRLEPGTHFQVVFYDNHRATPLKINGNAGMIDATKENLIQAKTLLRKEKAQNGTAHFQALMMGLYLNADILVLITDADDLDRAMVTKITDLNRGKHSIHTIEVSPRPSSDENGPLALLAARNHGSFRRIPSRSDD